METNEKIDLERYKLIVDSIFDATDSKAMGTRLIHLLVTSMGVKGATIFAVNPVAEALEILATEGLSIDYINKGPILVDQSIKLEPNRLPMIITDTRKSDKLQYPDKAEKEGVRSIISLPIKLKERIIGALRVYHFEPWEISSQELALLELVTVNIAMALRYFRLSVAILCMEETLKEIHPVWL